MNKYYYISFNLLKSNDQIKLISIISVIPSQTTFAQSPKAIVFALILNVIRISFTYLLF